MVHPDKPAPKKRRKPTPLKPSPALDTAVADATLDAERQEKIARIKKALDEGTYRVSTEDVARKVIEHMLQPKK